MDNGSPCVHCGLCLDTCATYHVSGNEADSPRGRLYIMDAVDAGDLVLDADAVGHLDSCLGCLACQTACPSAVDYGGRIEAFRPRLAAQRKERQVPLDDPRLVRAGLSAARVLDRLGLAKLRRRVPAFSLMPGSAAAGAPWAETEQSPIRRSRIAQPAYPRYRAALLNGCLADRLLPDINRAAVEVLQRNGVEMVEVEEQGCCGALDFHAGHVQAALQKASSNTSVFSRALDEGTIDFVVTTAAGCGAMTKDYPRLLQGDPTAHAATTVAAATRDICELLVELDFEVPVVATEGRPQVGYHDACHLLHAGGIDSAPRRVCAAASGRLPVDIGENNVCCGSAGSYNIDHHRAGMEMGQRKAELVTAADVDVVAVGNVGCLLQFMRALALDGENTPVRHPVELLAEAYLESS